jgi:predicted O-methyltransferase YrrM
MDIINKKINIYVEEHSDLEPEVLKQLNRETHLKVLMSRMLSGHFQGRVLSMLSKMIRPKNILEIGTYTGYSAICLAEGLQKGGSLTTIDINAELENMAKGYFEKAGISEQVNYIIGDATSILPTLNAKYDLVFIDADKKNNATYYDIVFDKLNQGGYIIADNVLWSGKVVEEKADKDTQLILDFNAKVQNDSRVENVLLPIRDGLLVVRKK